MKKSDYENPEQHIFYCDKSDWYVEDKEGNKHWDKSKEVVERFWQLVRVEKVKKNDCDFSEFVFPQFSKKNFWEEGEEKKFEETVIFRNATFLDGIHLEDIEFSKVALFDNSSFLAQAYFCNIVFLGNIGFSRVHFFEDTQFYDIKFSGNAHFDKNTFSKEVDFGKSTFYNIADFQSTVFSGNVNFTEVKFMSYAPFADAKFFNSVEFYNTDFESLVDFKDAKFHNGIYFSDTRVSFLDNLHIKSFSLKGAVLEESHFFWIKVFENVNFQDSFLLSLNLSNKQILNCNFTGAMIGAVQTRGWKPDKATLENTKFIYTDFEIKQTIDEDGEVSKTYHAKPESRVPAEGSFGEGENVDFTIADFLLDPTKWSYSLNLPKEIRSGFLGYIKFFEDFLRVTENEEVEIRTRREGNKVRVEFLTNDPEKKEFIEQEFQEYMQNLTKSPEEASVDFSHSKSTEIEKDLFELKYENRIKDLQTELKYTQKLLLKEEAHNQTLLSIQQAQTQPQKLLLSTPIPIQTDLAEIKRVFVDRGLKKALKMLSDYCGRVPNEFSSEATLLYGEFNRLEKQKSDYSSSEYDSRCSRISKRLMDILTEIEQDDEGL
jgi:uncharacterized protein YjbI with pentapeptide repeats